MPCDFSVVEIRTCHFCLFINNDAIFTLAFAVLCHTISDVYSFMIKKA